MKNTMFKASVCLVVGTCTSLALFANDNLEHISVVGARHAMPISQLSASTHILDEFTIQQSGELFLVDLLRGMPGISISRSGSIGGLTEVRLRGAETNHLLVMIDGVVVNDESQGGLFDFAHLTTDNIVRIELLSGAQSALWGSGAVAGVLNITTRTAASSATQVRMGLGNQAQRHASVNVSQRSTSSNWNFSASHLSTDGENVSRQGDEADGYQNSGISAGLQWQPAESHQLAFNLRYTKYKNDFDGVDYVNTGLPTDSDNWTDGKQWSGKLHWQFNDQNSKLTHHLEGQYSHHQNSNFTAGIDVGGSEADKLGGRYFIAAKLTNNTSLNAGLEHVRDDFEQFGPVTFDDPNQTQQIDTSSLFADFSAAVSKSVNLTASGRWDNNSDFDDQSSFRLGPNWQINDQLNVFVSYSKAIRNPTFTERFGFYPGSFLGNPNLQPEQALTTELGVRIDKWHFDQITLSWSQSNLKDEINGFVFVPEQGVFTAQNNRSDSRRNVAEISLTRQWNRLALRSHYTYVESEEGIEAGDFNQYFAELRRPRHTASFTLTFSPQESPLSAFVKADYTGTRSDQFFPPFPQPAQRVSLAAYWLINANLSYQLSDSATIQLNAHNLLDEEYEDIVGFVGKGRQIRVSLQYSI